MKILTKKQNAIRQTTGERCFDCFNVLFLIFVCVITLYPVLHVFFAAVSDPYAMASFQGLLLWPNGFSLLAIESVLTNPMIASGYGNTLFVLVVGTSINMVLTILGAFVLSRKNLLFKRTFMIFIIFTMLFQGGLIPLYNLVSTLNLDNTRWALILPVAVNTWNLIVMRSFFDTIPDSLEEAAKIDGANEFTVLTRIILPMSGAVIAVVCLFYAVYHWNAWFNAMIYLRDRSLYPLQLVLREILISNDISSLTGSIGSDSVPIGNTVKYATILVSTLPVLFIYPFMQKYFVKGMMVGAVKG